MTLVVDSEKMVKNCQEIYFLSFVQEFVRLSTRGHRETLQMWITVVSKLELLDTQRAFVLENVCACELVREWVDTWVCVWVNGLACVCVCVCVREREREQERFCVKAELCDRQMSLNGTKTNTATKHNWASHTLVFLSFSSLSFSLFFLFLFGCSEFFLSILFNKALLSFFQQISL